LIERSEKAHALTTHPIDPLLEEIKGRKRTKETY